MRIPLPLPAQYIQFAGHSSINLLFPSFSEAHSCFPMSQLTHNLCFQDILTSSSNLSPPNFCAEGLDPLRQPGLSAACPLCTAALALATTLLSGMFLSSHMLPSVLRNHCSTEHSLAAHSRAFYDDGSPSALCLSVCALMLFTVLCPQVSQPGNT